MDVKVIRDKKKWLFSYLLHWKGYPDSADLWQNFVPGDGTWTPEDLKLIQDYNPEIYQAAIEDRAKAYVSIEPGDWQLNPKETAKIFERWGIPSVDLFASARNRQVEAYFQKTRPGKLVKGCLGNNSLAKKWNWGLIQGTLYANPPWEELEQVAKKIKKDKVKRIIVITPKLLPSLVELEIEDRITLKHTDDLYIHPLLQKTKGNVGTGLPKWNESYALLCGFDAKLKTGKSVGSKIATKTLTWGSVTDSGLIIPDKPNAGLLVKPQSYSDVSNSYSDVSDEKRYKNKKKSL